LDWVILHTVVHHSSTSTYMPHFIGIEETFIVDGRTYGWTFETSFIRSTLSKSQPKNDVSPQYNVKKSKFCQNVVTVTKQQNGQI